MKPIPCINCKEDLRKVGVIKISRNIASYKIDSDDYADFATQSDDSDEQPYLCGACNAPIAEGTIK